MADVLLKLSPIVFTYLLGIILRRTGVVQKGDGALLIKIVFYVALPALIFLSVSRVEVTRDLVVLPLIAAIIILSTLAVGYAVARSVVSERKVFGVVLVGAVIMNTAFIYPFVLTVYGAEGFARTVLFDFGNGLLVSTLVYYVACRYGENARNPWSSVGRVAASPPLWALLLGLVFNFGEIPVHPAAESFLTSVGNLMVPLVMLALGVYFSPRLVRWPLLIAVMLIRSVGGLALALLLVQLFGLEGLNRSVVLVCGASPIGFNTLVYASIAGLDVEFAASLLSTSIFLGILYLPVLLVVLS